MIAEDYVSYEVSKLLKEKGFDEPCLYYYKDGVLMFSPSLRGRNSYQTDTYSAPTHQMAMKWLRDVHGIIITIDYDEDEDCENNERYGFTIYKSTRTVDLSTFPTFEEAVDAALKYYLTELI